MYITFFLQCSTRYSIMKSLKVIIRWIFLLKLVSSIKEENEKFTTSHVEIDLKEIPKIIIDLLNQCVLMKLYSKTPASDKLCNWVEKNVIRYFYIV